MTLPEETLTLAWCSGGDIMIHNEDGPERVSTQRAAELLAFWSNRLDRPDNMLTGVAKTYALRWAHDLDRAILAQDAWTRCTPLQQRAA